MQFACDQVRHQVNQLNIKQSMSRKGNCYYNAFVESFFKTLKAELPKTKFSSIEEAIRVIFKYIEGWYNTKRMHSLLDYMSPLEYKKQMLAS